MNGTSTMTQPPSGRGNTHWEARDRTQAFTEGSRNVPPTDTLLTPPVGPTVNLTLSRPRSMLFDRRARS